MERTGFFFFDPPVAHYREMASDPWFIPRGGWSPPMHNDPVSQWNRCLTPEPWAPKVVQGAGRSLGTSKSRPFANIQERRKAPRMRGVVFFVKPRFAILLDGAFVIKRLRKGRQRPSAAESLIAPSRPLAAPGNPVCAVSQTSPREARGSGGGGGNRTRVPRCSVLGLYAHSPSFGVATGAPTNRISGNQLDCFSSRAGRAATHRPACCVTPRPPAGEGTSALVT